MIATAREIEDAGALVFAVSFYSAIASGQSVRAALDQARLAMDQLPTAQGDVIASWLVTTSTFATWCSSRCRPMAEVSRPNSN